MGAMRAAKSSERFRVGAVPLIIITSAQLFFWGGCGETTSPPAASNGDAGSSGAPPSSGGTGDGTGGRPSSGGASGGTGGRNTAGAGGGADAECGNGLVEDGEACDDGKETSKCNADCTRAECGDGVHNAAANEECDDGGESAECNADCTLAVCGDEKVNAAAGEECDGEFRIFDLNRWWVVTTNYCPNCKLNVCGDGIRLEPGPACAIAEIPECGTLYEVCDTGGDSPTCNFDCTNARCGDGYTNEARGEQCDDGNNTWGDGCDGVCQLEP